jgi:hypothetical protein
MMMIKQKLNFNHDRNMCYSGEWCEGSGIEPVVSESFELQNLLSHEKFCMGTKRKELGQIKARNVITACKITV